MLEPAVDRFHRLVYQHMLATGDSQTKAFDHCASVHKETFALMQKEGAAREAETVAANEAAEAQKVSAANHRRARMERVKEAVEAKMKAMRSMDYPTAYRAVQREQPELFVAMEGPSTPLS